MELAKKPKPSSVAPNHKPDNGHEAVVSSVSGPLQQHLSNFLWFSIN